MAGRETGEAMASAGGGGTSEGYAHHVGKAAFTFGGRGGFRRSGMWSETVQMARARAPYSVAAAVEPGRFHLDSEDAHLFQEGEVFGIGMVEEIG